MASPWFSRCERPRVSQVLFLQKYDRDIWIGGFDLWSGDCERYESMMDC